MDINGVTFGSIAASEIVSGTWRADAAAVTSGVIEVDPSRVAHVALLGDGLGSE